MHTINGFRKRSSSSWATRSNTASAVAKHVLHYWVPLRQCQAILRHSGLGTNEMASGIAPLQVATSIVDFATSLIQRYRIRPVSLPDSQQTFLHWLRFLVPKICNHEDYEVQLVFTCKVDKNRTHGCTLSMDLEREVHLLGQQGATQHQWLPNMYCSLHSWVPPWQCQAVLRHSGFGTNDQASEVAPLQVATSTLDFATSLIHRYWIRPASLPDS